MPFGERKGKAPKPLTLPSRGRKVARGIKMVVKGVLTVVMAVLLVVDNTVVPSMTAGMVGRMANDMLGYQQSWDNTNTKVDPDKGAYYTSDFTEDEIGDAQHALDRRIADEGYVLLKNDNHTMPFAEGTTFSFFGESSKHLGESQSLVTQFIGASGSYDKLNEAFENEGFSVNTELEDFYLSDDASQYDLGKGSISFGQDEDFAINECPLSVLKGRNGLLDSAEGTVPVFALKRVAGEGRDMPRSMYNHTDNADDQQLSYLTLDSDEREILSYLNDNFDQVVVVVNTASALEFDWLADYPNVKAIVYMPSAGTYGIESLAGIFSGSVNPSGRTVDTFAADASTSPAAQNYGDYAYLEADGKLSGYNYVTYEEGIYVGYRYYETRYEDAVLGQGNAGAYDYADEVVYPFGYGLSYTDFAWSDFTTAQDGTTVTTTVTVTNTGDVAGRDVVELYVQSPYTDYDKTNGVEKAAVELVQYAKTDLLDPGESQTLTLSFDVDQLKAYDAQTAKTYILDGGTYYVTAATDAHAATNNILAAKGSDASVQASGVSAGSETGDAALVAPVEIAGDVDTTTYATDSYTGTAVTNQFDAAKGDATYLTRSDWEGTFPKHDGEPIEGEVSTWGNEINGTDGDGNPASLVYGKTASDELLAQLDSFESNNPVSDDEITDEPVYGQDNGLTLIDLRGLDYDDPQWDALLDQLTPEDYEEVLGHSGYGIEYLESVGKPFNIDADTAAGLIYGGGGSAIGGDSMMFCSPITVAQTYNQDIATDYGHMIGSEGVLGGASGWYAPSMNIHRTPYSGRNNEYYSEDPFVSGTVASLEIKGAADKGMYAYIKHFALNDQENHRGDNSIGTRGGGLVTWANEQSIREMYLLPFEMCMKVGDVEETYVDADGDTQTREQRAAQGIMSSFNRIGATWAGGDYALLTGIARDEWGFDGMVITDSANGATDLMNVSQMIRAGGDTRLLSNPSDYTFDETDVAEYHYARKALHHVLYITANSRAMQGAVPGSVYKPGLQAMDRARIAVNVIAIVSLALLAGTGWRNHKRNQRERELAASLTGTQK